MTDLPNHVTIGIAFAAGVALTAAIMATNGAFKQTNSDADRNRLTAAELAEVRRVCGENTGWPHSAAVCTAIALRLCEKAFYTGERRDRRQWLNCELYDGDWVAYLDENVGGKEGQIENGLRIRIASWLRTNGKLVNRTTIDLVREIQRSGRDPELSELPDRPRRSGR